MHEKLEDIRDLLDKSTADGRDYEAARSIADELVTEEPNMFSQFDGRPVEGEGGLAESVDVLRAAGMEDELWLVQAWLLHKFEPQNIGGVAAAQVRIV